MKMTGPEMKDIRERLDLSVVQLGRAIGYTGNRATVDVTVRRYELGSREIPPWIARLVWMFGKHGVPKRFLEEGE